MGEVYRATDTILKRQVAIKVLPAAVAGDIERLARFKREAEVLASLNHPNIAHIYGLDDTGGVKALVMELVEGPTLADRIADAVVPVEEALSIAQQIAEALEAAHSQGIMHRDLKPANIKVRLDGTVKVLDFGLAKAMVHEAAAESASEAATITTPAMTEAGVILGTAAYMAPEQAKGRHVDQRVDVWAFGAVLYEMITRRRAFQGEDVSDTLAAVLRAEPDWTRLPASTPTSIRRLLRRCLEKDRRSRLSDMAMVRLELREAGIEAAAPPPSATGVAAGRSRLALIVGALVLTTAAGFGGWLARRPSQAPRPLARFSLELPPALLPRADSVNSLALSPDGSHLVIATNRRLYLRALDTSELTPIPATEGGGDRFARLAFFSPDGQWIGFWQEGQLRKVPIGGGRITTICDVVTPAAGTTWTADEILFADDKGIWSVPASGGTPTLVSANEPGTLAQDPQPIAGTDWILFSIGRANVQQAVLVSRADGHRRVVVEDARNVRYVPPGHVLFDRGGTLFAQAFNPSSGTMLESAVPLVQGVAANVGVALASSGTLAYYAVSSEPPESTRLVQVSRAGTSTPLGELNGSVWYPRFSPDGSKIAYGLSASPGLGGPADVWVLDLQRGAQTRVTFGGNNRHFPTWTHDGTRITTANGIAAPNDVISASADGSGVVVSVLGKAPRSFPTSWSPDGRTLALHTGGGAGPGTSTSRDIVMWSVGTSSPTPFVATPFEERGPAFSPNGRWVAFVSNKSGMNDVYARPFPGPGEEITLSVGGGGEPVWGRSGRELFYRHEGKLLVVPLRNATGTLSAGKPTVLFTDPYRLDISGSAGGVANYDVSPDGQRFVMVEPLHAENSQPRSARIEVVLNWSDQLERLALAK